MKKRMSKARRHVRGLLSFVATFLVVFVLLDTLVFRGLVWRVPDETAWESEPLYSFEHRMRALERSDKPADEFRVLVIGSSIATYSVLHQRLEKKLNALMAGPRHARVYMLGRQGSNALQMLALQDRFHALKPDLVIWPVNFVDFRLERPFVPDVRNAVKRGVAPREAYARDLLKSDEFRVFSPLGTLRCCSEYLDLNGKATMLLSWMVAAYRYRDIHRVGIKRALYNRTRSGRSYLNYAGGAVGGGGVTHRGRVGREFSLMITPRLKDKGLYFQAPDALFKKPGPVRLTLTLHDGKSPGAKPLETRVIRLKPGWQRVKVAGSPGQILRGRMQRAYYSELKADDLTLRLARNTGAGPRAGLSDLRELRREDLNYASYSDAEYRASFRTRILRFNRAGMEYLHALRLAKGEWSRRKFDPSLPSLQAFTRFRARSAAAKVPLVVFNIPENPLSLEWYGDSNWYGDFVKFLSRPSRGFLFFDLHDRLPMGDFYDYHHLSFRGADKTTSLLAEKLKTHPSLKYITRPP